jgi:hypothetical protein
MSGTFGYQAFGFTSPSPNAADFATVLNTEVGIPITILATIGTQMTAALAYAVHWTYRQLACVDNAIYLRAVYCLAVDRLLLFGRDPANKSSTVFADLRKSLSLESFQPGVIASSGDEGTSQSFEVAEPLRKLTLPDLQNMKTRWGREYLGYAQQAAPIWGLS